MTTTNFVLGTIIALGIGLSTQKACRKTQPKYKASYSVSLDHIREIKELHLMKYYFEEVIPIDKKDKLKVLLIVQASVDSYINMADVKIERDSLGLIVTLPEIKIGEIAFAIDSAKVYDFKHFGISFSDNAYGEAIADIQDGIAKARIDIKAKCLQQGIIARSILSAKDWFHNWGQMIEEEIVVKTLDGK